MHVSPSDMVAVKKCELCYYTTWNPDTFGKQRGRGVDGIPQSSHRKGYPLPSLSSSSPDQDQDRVNPSAPTLTPGQEQNRGTILPLLFPRTAQPLAVRQEDYLFKNEI